MKAKVGKTTVSAKVPSKAQSKPAKATVAMPAAKKMAVKPVEKKSAKSAKGGPGPVAKTNAKAAVKAGAGSMPKPPAKPAVKTPAKAAKPVAAKVTAQPAVTAKNQKPAPKAMGTKVNSVLPKTAKTAKTGDKPAAKTVSKALPKPVAKPVAKPVGKPAAPAPAQASAKPVAKAAPAPAPVVVPASALQVPVKAGRPSSRLAQLTVPSMAQSVASTAAKSSFTQSTALPLIVPPLPSATKKDPKLANNWKTKPVEQLTDAELLSMPDSEYMNDKQMAVFRLKLSILKQDILNSASDTTEHLREDTVVVPDPADRATIEEEHALELRTRDRERKLLKKIEQSINRIDAGDYGYCDETGEPIGVGRLLARPTATLSLEAQQRRELKQKMFGD